MHLSQEKKWILLGVFSSLLISGCVGTKKAYILPEDRIYTAEAGKPMSLVLDGKPLEITFPTNMKVVHESILIRHEENLNKETLKKVKAEKSRNKWIKILGSITTLFAGLMAYFKKKKD